MTTIFRNIAEVLVVGVAYATSARGLDWWYRFAFALAVTSGIIPLLGATGWPTKLRVAHAIEIVVFALVYAFGLWQILAL